MRNPKAVGAFVAGVAAIAVVGAVAAIPPFVSSVDPLKALVLVPLALALGLASVALGRRARFDFQRTLGRIGGYGLAQAGTLLGIAALLLSLTAALAVGVYAVLTFTQQ